MNETSTTVGYSGTTTTTSVYPGTTTHWGISPGVTISDSSNYSLSQAITNSNNMSKQVKVAVFTVERNDKNEVKSSKFVKEFWVEVKNGGSVVLAAARQLDRDYDPDTTVIREIQTVTF
jgi:hypothetical protein